MTEVTGIHASNRAQALPENFFYALEGKLQELKSAGKDVIRLDMGSPDLPPRPEIIASLEHSARNPENHGYQSMKGPLELRTAWSSYYAQTCHVNLDAETEILPLAGSKEGIFNFTQAWVNPGDVVIVPDPGYMTYSRASLFAGAEIFNLRLDPGNGYLPDLASIPQDILRRTRVMFLNYPNNPTAAVADAALFSEVVHLAKEFGFWVCHDAAYQRVTFDGFRAPSILEAPGSRDVAVEFNSLSKSHNMAGWRVGAVVGSRQAIRPLSRLEANMNSGLFRPVIDAAITALTGDPAWTAGQNEIYRRRRDRVIAGLASLGVEVEPPRGSIYVWCPVPPGWKCEHFVLDVLEKAGVSFTPGTVFGLAGEGYIRISLTVDEDRITEAMQRLSLWRMK